MPIGAWSKVLRKHGFRLAQVIAHMDQIGDLGDRADPARNTVGGHHLFREMPDLAVGLGAVCESTRDGLPAEIRPGAFHARAVFGVHAQPPGIGAMPGLQSEDAAVTRIAVDQLPGRVRVIDGNRRALEQGCGGYGVGMQ